MELKQLLLENEYSLAASNGYCSKDNGIKPVLMKLNEKIDYFKDLDVADKIVGKASAMLLTLSGVRSVYALTLSKAGLEIFEKYHIPYAYDELTDYIVNRTGDGMCPMEMTVKEIDDLQDAYLALKNKVQEMMKR
ncbi:MAG: DUF1893 domain-containing protein [Erysipelotrichaceae bacterium]|nr:DUF1893 domain-containing protein [Erysipelotrichaceae bacterium]